MTASAQRSKAEVDALYWRALETMKTINDALSMSPGPSPVGMFAASRGLHSAILQYYVESNHEWTFNALRNAISRAEKEIDNYKRQVRG